MNLLTSIYLWDWAFSVFDVSGKHTDFAFGFSGIWQRHLFCDSIQKPPPPLVCKWLLPLNCRFFVLVILELQHKTVINKSLYTGKRYFLRLYVFGANQNQVWFSLLCIGWLDLNPFTIVQHDWLIKVIRKLI